MENLDGDDDDDDDPTHRGYSSSNVVETFSSEHSDEPVRRLQ